GTPDTITAPGGASRHATSTSSPSLPSADWLVRPKCRSTTTAISYGPASCASPTERAYPANLGCRTAIGATVASAASAASRYRVCPLNAVYAVSAATSADSPDGV